MKKNENIKIKMKNTNVFNDGVKNVEEKGNIGERVNMPAGSKYPLPTVK